MKGYIGEISHVGDFLEQFSQKAWEIASPKLSKPNGEITIVSIAGEIDDEEIEASMRVFFVVPLPTQSLV